MDLFHIIDDAQAIIKQNGVFRQVKVYRRGIDIYVASGTEFIKLMSRGNTSVPSVSWLDLDAKDVEMHPAGSHKTGQPEWRPQPEAEKETKKTKGSNS